MRLYWKNYQNHSAILLMIRILTKSLPISSSPFLPATKSPKAMDLMNALVQRSFDWGHGIPTTKGKRKQQKWGNRILVQEIVHLRTFAGIWHYFHWDLWVYHWICGIGKHRCPNWWDHTNSRKPNSFVGGFNTFWMTMLHLVLLIPSHNMFFAIWNLLKGTEQRVYPVVK